jgi:hypothetical protein
MPGTGTITDLLDEAYYERQQITRLLVSRPPRQGASE